MHTFLKWITRHTFEHLHFLNAAHSSQPCSPCYRLTLFFRIRSFDLGHVRQYSQLLYLRHSNQLPITLSTHFCDMETCFKISRFITSCLSTRYWLLRFRSDESVCVFCQIKRFRIWSHFCFIPITRFIFRTIPRTRNLPLSALTDEM